ncbi:B-cell receptor CD22-like [Neolamprologus brichardi]|uniref:B-cell receptor CD22-like n=1 Tax=Neolamprologus brichardi TaxID=32507 RepID=UPI001643CE59|nr:B-cell receptor CD22-like [Neolamprologus brichardi]
MFSDVLCVTVVQSQNGWGVTYTSTQICAVKGSSVEIRCTYTYPPRINNETIEVQKRLWFTKLQQDVPVDLKTDPNYDARVEYNFFRNNSTLRITDLRESDSAQYKFRFETNNRSGRYTGSPGVTLLVTDAPIRPSVSVTLSGEIVEGSSVTLTCSSDANRAANYTWYKEDDQKPLSKDSQLIFSSIQSSDAGEYYCIAVNNLGTKRTGHNIIIVNYAPKLPSVSVSPSAEIVEGSSVTLTCSSDANPAAQYTWYKNNDRKPLSESFRLGFNSIQSSDSGEYYCKARNKLGMKTSRNKLLDVKYAPKFLSLSVSPSDEIVEGSPVNLICSSDANPAANYTWYKDNKELSARQQGVYHFISISLEDSGDYSCKSENVHGEANSTSLSVDVQYPPRLPSVSVSPSAEIVEGSSVTLTCSSDANPAANYTWYKEDDESPKASGQNFTITDIQPEHSGSYYCVAQNSRGHQNSILQLNVVPGQFDAPHS